MLLRSTQPQDLVRTAPTPAARLLVRSEPRLQHPSEKSRARLRPLQLPSVSIHYGLTPGVSRIGRYSLRLGSDPEMNHTCTCPPLFPRGDRLNELARFSRSRAGYKHR